MAEKAKVPAIRFEGFTDAWEQRKLGEIVTIKSGVSPSTFELGNELYVKVDDLNYSFRDQTDSQMKVADNSRCSKVKKGSIIFPKRGAAIMTNKVRIMGACGYMDTNMMALEPKEISSEYLYLFISKTGLYKIADTSTIPQINNKHIEPYEIMMPRIEEQQQIGQFFRNLDNLITLHQRKLLKLKNVKKAMLEKMFPKNGSSVPEIRFAGFTDAWKQRKLGEVLADMYNGQTPYRLNEDNWNGNINWLSSGELNRGVVTKTVEKITPQGQKDANLKLIPKGTFVIAITGLEASGTRGNCAILGLDTTMNQSCMALFPVKELLDSRFLFQWYRKVSEEYGISYTQGTKQQSYNAEIIKLLPINLPSLKEQNKIAQFLFDFDNFITLHQRKLEKLQNVKKACLEKMFV